LNIIHPGSHSWHQGFPKHIGVNEENASLEICASPYPFLAKAIVQLLLNNKEH